MSDWSDNAQRAGHEIERLTAEVARLTEERHANLWSHVVNGVFETSPLPPGVTILTVPAEETSATLGSPWDLKNPSDEIKNLRARNAALEATNAALEDIEYGSPNPDEMRATLAKIRTIVTGHEAALVVSRVLAALDEGSTQPEGTK